MPDSTRFLGVSLKFYEREVDIESDEPYQFVQRYSGEVRIWDHHDDDDQRVGWFHAILMDVVRAMDEGESMFDMFDCDATTLDYFGPLYEPTGEVRAEAMDLIYGRQNWVWAPNLLILDRLEILPSHRGMGIGLIALRGLIRCLSAGDCIAAMKPFPLQCEPKRESGLAAERRDAMQLDALPKDYRRATAALRRYYKRLGFKTLRGTEFMVRDARKKLPNVSDLTGSQ